VLAALGSAIWFQRGTIADALAEMRNMAAGVVALLVLLGIVERLTRADILRRLLGRPTFGRALTIHDVGSAASKGVPLGGPLATGLRWSIARDASIPTTTFMSALVAYGVATTYVTWLLPLGWLVADTTQRTATTTDVAALIAGVVVLGGSTLFWTVMLGSERVATRMVAWTDAVGARIARRIPAVGAHDPGAALLDVRSSLRLAARRPVGLLLQTAVAQSIGAAILLVALRGLGVGVELGTVEFLRIYFVVTLLSSFVPVPGGLGVIEAGLTGALVAAGVEPSTALAGVLVYRLFTYVAPILLGGVLYVAWRVGRARDGCPGRDLGDDLAGPPDVERHVPARRRVGSPATGRGAAVGIE